MKLRGKLISSFASVVAGTLMVFGVITYHTFAESTKQSLNQIVNLDNTQLVLRVTAKFNNKIEKMYQILSPDLMAIMSQTIKGEEAGHLLRSLASQEPIFHEILLYDFRNRQLTSLSDKSWDPAILPILKKMVASDTSQIFTLDDKLYLLAFTAAGNGDVSLLVEVDQAALTKLLRSLLTINQATLYITEKERPVIPAVFTAIEGQPAPVEYASIPPFKAGQQHLDMGDAGQAYRLPETLFGADLTYILPNSYFITNLVALKNRIITAMFVIGWCSLWVILILANRISAPIKALTKSTKDIIAFNYSNELSLTNGSDEIGELAGNFEVMRKNIKDLVTKDQLTHVYNRRFLMHLFELAVLKAVRLEEELCCIIIDIDFFKKVNDTYGHQAGDYVLAEMGKVLHEQTRDYDSSARYGGEEFMFIMPEASIQKAWEVAERIRKAMEERVIIYEDQRIKCTLSMGVSAFDQYTANTTEKIIQNADTALYQAKRSGRNKTVIYTTDLSGTS